MASVRAQAPSVHHHGQGKLQRRSTKERQKPTRAFETSMCNSIYNRMKLDPERSSLLSEYVKAMQKEAGTAAAGLLERQCQFTTTRLAKEKSGKDGGSKAKESARAVLLKDQLTKLEEKHKAEMGVLEDTQAFVKARSKLEMEYASNLQKLAQTYHNKRKWPDFAYSKGHNNILMVDLWRSVVNLGMEDAKAHAIGSEQLATLSGEIFEKGKEEKKIAMKQAHAMLVNLQDELIKLDTSVTETKQKYAASRKLFTKTRDSKKARPAAELKKAETSWQFARHEYILEIAAANEQYLKFRDLQLPEVMASATVPTFRFVSNFFKAYAGSLGLSLQTCGKNMKKIDKLASKLGAEFEQRIFLHEHRREFPGRQMFEVEPLPDDVQTHELMADASSRHTLLKIRELLKHTVKTMESALAKKSKELYSLLGLHDNYLRAGGLVDQSQRRVLVAKMSTLHSELEDEMLQTTHLKSKISRITNDLGTDDSDGAGGATGAGGANGIAGGAGAGDGGAVAGASAGKAVDESEMLYLDQAQALDMSRREEEETAAARALQDINGKAKGRGSKSKPDKEKGKSKLGSKHETKKAGKLAKLAKKRSAAPSSPAAARAAPHLQGAADEANNVEDEWDDEESMYINSAETKAEYAAADSEWLPPPPQIFDDALAGVDGSSSGGGGGANTDTGTASFDAGTPPPPPPPGDNDDDADGEENSYADFPLPDDSAGLPPPPDASDSFYQNVQDVLSAGATGMKAGERLNAGAGLNVTVMSSMEEMSQVHYETAVAENAALSASGVSAGFYANTTEGIYEELCEAEVPLFYRAIYDYTAAQADDLSIQAGDVLYVLVARDDGWCQGLSTNGKCGFFPQSYVEKVELQDSIAADKPRIVMLTPSAADSLKVEMHPGCPPTVVEVVAGSIPESVGIRVGDCLLEVDEEPCASSSFGTVSSWLSQCESGRTLKMCLVSVARIANETSSA